MRTSNTPKVNYNETSRKMFLALLQIGLTEEHLSSLSFQELTKFHSTFIKGNK